MPITINGAGTIDLGSSGSIANLAVGGLPDGVVDTDMLANLAVATGKIANNAVTDAKAAISTGKIGQVVQAVKKDTTTDISAINSGSDDEPSYMTMIGGLQPSITPVATSSKILIMYDVAITGNFRYHGISLWRGSTLITDAIGDEQGTKARVTKSYAGNDDATNHIYTGPYNVAGSFLDSPNTTSSTTYKIGAGVHNTSGSSPLTKVNQTFSDDNNYYSPRTISTVTLMEVLA